MSTKYERKLLKALLKEEALLNKNTKELYIPDVSGEPYKVYGLQIADLSNIPDKELIKIAKEYGLLSNFALAHYPAPGTCAKDRMDFYGFPIEDTIEDNTDEKKEDITNNYKEFLAQYRKNNLINETEYIKELKGRIK